jgi:hypothetical protein
LLALLPAELALSETASQKVILVKHLAFFRQKHRKRDILKATMHLAHDQELALVDEEEDQLSSETKTSWEETVLRFPIFFNSVLFIIARTRKV